VTELRAVYDDYTNNPDTTTEFAFYAGVIHYARACLYGLEVCNEYRHTGTTDTVDDHSQRAAVAIWRAVQRGAKWLTFDHFKKYLKLTILHRRNDFLVALRDTRDNYESLFCDQADEKDREDHPDSVDDNSAAHKKIVGAFHRDKARSVRGEATRARVDDCPQHRWKRLGYSPHQEWMDGLEDTDKLLLSHLWLGHSFNDMSHDFARRGVKLAPSTIQRRLANFKDYAVAYRTLPMERAA
jgi:hypothetical protein